LNSGGSREQSAEIRTENRFPQFDEFPIIFIEHLQLRRRHPVDEGVYSVECVAVGEDEAFVEGVVGVPVNEGSAPPLFGGVDGAFALEVADTKADGAERRGVGCRAVCYVARVIFRLILAARRRRSRE
jgi:hypothetical protein